MDCLLLGVSAEGHYLYFDLDFLSRCYQLIQCLLGVLHVAAVLPVDQQPGEGYKATRLVNLNTLPQHGEEITHSDKVKTFRLMFDHGCFWPKNIYYILIWSHSRVKTQVGLSLKSIEKMKEKQPRSLACWLHFILTLLTTFTPTRPSAAEYLTDVPAPNDDTLNVREKDKPTAETYFCFSSASIGAFEDMWANETCSKPMVKI